MNIKLIQELDESTKKHKKIFFYVFCHQKTILNYSFRGLQFNDFYFSIYLQYIAKLQLNLSVCVLTTYLIKSGKAKGIASL